MFDQSWILFEVAILLVGSLLVVVLALRVFYQDAYERARTQVVEDTPDEGSFSAAGEAPWLGPETRRVLVELGVTDLRKVARLSPLQIHAIEFRLRLGAGRIAAERWIERAKEALSEPQS
jgi:hypothetical protein